MVEALKKDYRTAPITEQDRTMLDYVVKLTKDATKCSLEDHSRLRAAGFDDRGMVKRPFAALAAGLALVVKTGVGAAPETSAIQFRDVTPQAGIHFLH